jgi:hypothetical protein
MIVPFNFPYHSNMMMMTRKKRKRPQGTEEKEK